MPTLNVSVPVSEECLCDILSTIFEQSVGYWVGSYSAHGRGWEEKVRAANDGILYRYMAPAYCGYLLIRTNEEAGSELYSLTRKELLAGIARAAGEGRFAISEDMAGDIDCEIADVILQYAILGEIRFG